MGWINQLHISPSKHPSSGGCCIVSPGGRSESAELLWEAVVAGSRAAGLSQSWKRSVGRLVCWQETLKQISGGLIIRWLIEVDLNIGYRKQWQTWKRRRGACSHRPPRTAPGNADHLEDNSRQRSRRWSTRTQTDKLHLVSRPSPAYWEQRPARLTNHISVMQLSRGEGCLTKLSSGKGNASKIQKQIIIAVKITWVEAKIYQKILLHFEQTRHQNAADWGRCEAVLPLSVCPSLSVPWSDVCLTINCCWFDWLSPVESIVWPSSATNHRRVRKLNSGLSAATLQILGNIMTVNI